MCGRFTLFSPGPALQAHFHLPEPPALRARYNIAPSQDIAVVRSLGQGERALGMLRWGLIPGWAKDLRIGYRMINARAETVAEKPAFRNAFRQRRCLIPADGFYEWQRRDGAKQPWYFHRRDEALFAFAGLWEHWDRAGELVESCTIITTRANRLMAPVHERMPVILGPDDYLSWMETPATEAGSLLPLLEPCADDWLTTYPVSSRVNSPGTDTLALIHPREDV